MPPSGIRPPGLVGWLLYTLAVIAVVATLHTQKPSSETGSSSTSTASSSASSSSEEEHKTWEWVTPVATTMPRSKRDIADEDNVQRRNYLFWAFGQRFHLQLRCQDNFYPPTLKVQERTGNTSRWVAIQVPPGAQGQCCFHEGHVEGDTSSLVALSLCQGLMGHIRTSQGRFFIEPATFTANTTGVHKIYKHLNHPHHCDLHDTTEIVNVSAKKPIDTTRYQHENNHIRKKRSDSMDLNIEVMVVADSKMYRYHRQNLHHYVLTLMSIVSLIYREPSIGNSLSISVVKLVVINEDVDREIIYASAARTLKSFCKWQALQNDPDDNSPNHHDTAILLTREDICRSPKKCDTLGLAELGTMCDPYRSCSIVEDNGLSAAFTIAHELGHVLSMPHDDDILKCRRFNHGKAYHVMARMLDFNTYPWAWSNCSSHFLTEFLDAGSAYCLQDEPVNNKLRGRYAEDQQAGEVFGDDKQCELLYGYGSTICPYMPVCKLLWCMNSEQVGCRTHHMPWADGTKCGEGKWCQKGECKPADRNALRPVDGRWGRWGKYGLCSRTCGGGIQKQTRECTRPKPRNGGKYCIGRRSRYRSCNTKPCPVGSRDFREEQCSSFNGKHFNMYGVPPNVSWIPVTTGVTPKDRCKLYCRVANGNAYYVLREKVIDGTPCAPDTYDICVNGICKPSGCDHVMGSNKKLDMCGVCGGNNSTCKTITGFLNRKLAYGYTDIVTIPIGSTNIDIRQKGYNNSEKDDNYIALKSPDEEYILNGNFSVVLFKKLIQYGGSLLEYTGAGSTEERINSSKPLQKDLIVQILSVKDLLPPDIYFEYVISVTPYKWQSPSDWSVCSRVCQGERYREPKCIRTSDAGNKVDERECLDISTKPPTHKEGCNLHCRLRWEITHKSECSAHCGIGNRTLTVNCIQSFSGKNDRIVDDWICDHLANKPPHKERCEEPCTRAHWEYGPWSKCSQTCGRGGHQFRMATCVMDGTVVNDIECSHHIKLNERSCGGDSECPKWQVGEWVYCSVTCGTGEQHRPYWCEVAGIKVAGVHCDRDSIPHHKQTCTITDCPQWDSGPWGQCTSTCGRGVSSRDVWCRGSNGKILDSSDCNARDKPDEVTECPLPPCDDINDTNQAPSLPAHVLLAKSKKTWRTGAWSECTNSCGEGIRKRVVVCYDEENRQDLNEKECKHLPRPSAIELCREKRCGRWRIGEWSQCTVSCGMGLAVRKITCILDDDNEHALADDCDPAERPIAEQICYRHREACNNGSQGIDLFTWHAGLWGWCSRTCGGGFQRRQVVCQDENGDHADLCDNKKKPTEMSDCNSHACPTWKSGYWGDCTRTCGEGIQRRRVICQKDSGQEVSASQCEPTLRPADEQPCNRHACGGVNAVHHSRWHPSPWSSCSVTCGGGIRERLVECIEDASGNVVSSSNCEDSEPSSTEKCSEMPCPRWSIATEWTTCSVTCGIGTQVKRAVCINGDNTTVSDGECSGIPPRVETRVCTLPSCPVQWYKSEWTQCTKSCGRGTQQRLVFCMDSNSKQAEDDRCSHLKKPRNKRACNKHPCPFMWISGSWSECSTTCGTGFQTRDVVCHKINPYGWVDPSPVSSGCEANDQPKRLQECNYGECGQRYHWQAGAWSQCSASCGTGLQRRRIYCKDRSTGNMAPRHRCSKETRPPRKQTCWSRPCGNSSCLDIQRAYNIRSDGEYQISIRGRPIEMYCTDMNTLHPHEYLTLPTEQVENYSEMYGKRLINPESCPYNGIRPETCECVDDTKDAAGLTVFSKIRVNITDLKIIANDFSFSQQYYGHPIPYAEAGDCYSMVNCPQGRFSINVVGTGFIISEFNEWTGQGNNITTKILRNKDKMRVQGSCGGYCGKCMVNAGLQLDVAPP